MNAAGKILVKTCLKAIRDTLISKYVIFLSNRRGKFKLLGLRFPRLVGHPNLSVRKTLRVGGLLTAMTFFQSKNFTACKVRDEEVETIFLLFDDVQTTEDYPSI